MRPNRMIFVHKNSHSWKHWMKEHKQAPLLDWIVCHPQFWWLQRQTIAMAMSSCNFHGFLRFQSSNLLDTAENHQMDNFEIRLKFSATFAFERHFESNGLSWWWICCLLEMCLFLNNFLIKYFTHKWRQYKRLHQIQCCKFQQPMWILWMCSLCWIVENSVMKFFNFI